MLDIEKKRMKDLFPNIVLLGEEMKNHCTLKIGGKCAMLICPSSINQLRKVLKELKNLKLNYRIIGAGSNILFSNNLSKFCFISLKNILGITIDVKNQKVNCYAGEKISSVFNKSMIYGLSGFERLIGIPGTIGGAIINNAGAFGVEIKDILESVQVLDKEGKLKTLKNKELCFSYRYSNLKNSNNIIISAVFKLESLAPSVINSIAKEIINQRNLTQPKGFSAGSVFKKINGVSAGKLIDDAGLKGYKIGGCEISQKHANFIINNGSATYKDYRSLVNFIKKKIKKIYNINLDTEIEFI